MFPNKLLLSISFRMKELLRRFIKCHRLVLGRRQCIRGRRPLGSTEVFWSTAFWTLNQPEGFIDVELWPTDFSRNFECAICGVREVEMGRRVRIGFELIRCGGCFITLIKIYAVR